MFRAHVLIVRRAKIVLYSLWYHHTYRWPSHAQIERGLSQSAHGTATYRCDDTRDCIIQFCPPDDEHMCSKHVEAWNKIIIKFSASSWLILENKYTQMHSQQNIKKKCTFVSRLLSSNNCTYNTNRVGYARTNVIGSRTSLVIASVRSSIHCNIRGVSQK